MTRKLGVILLSGGLDSTTSGDGGSSGRLRPGCGHRALRPVAQQGTRRGCGRSNHSGNPPGSCGRIVLPRARLVFGSHKPPIGSRSPEGRTPDEMAADIPITYVPMRNTFLLSLASAYLESHVLQVLEGDGAPPQSIEAALFIAANAIDYSGYPDCRPEFYETLTETLRLGSKIGTQYGIPFMIQTPLLAMTKAEIVRHAVAIGAPLERTWSCYEGGSSPCGSCDSCLLRAKGFAEAGVADPALAVV